MRVLVADPDPISAKLIDAALRSEGIIGEPAETGEDAVDIAKHYDFDALILGWRLSDIEALEVTRRLRKAKIRSPILILFAADDVDDKVEALVAGADDCLTKPFHKSELIARVQALIRRSRGHTESIIQTGQMVVNLETRSVEVEGKRLHVSGKEYSALELLSLRKGTILTKEMFLDHLYGGINEPDIKIIDGLIHKIRKKVAEATDGSHYIETVWGRGYVLRDPDIDSYWELNAREDIRKAITVIEGNLLADPSIADKVLPSDVNFLKQLRLELKMLLLIVESKESADDELIQLKLDALGHLSISLQHLVNSKLELLAGAQAELERESAVMEGNLARTTGPGRPRTGRGERQSWIAETKFRTDSFNMMADFAKCLHKSKKNHQKILCNVLFIIELLNTLSAILAQLVPFAARK